jgi:GNAT superfamily N-acetyltransferase
MIDVLMTTGDPLDSPLVGGTVNRFMRYAEILTEGSKTVAEKYITDVYRRLKRLGHENIVAYLEPEDDRQVSLDSIDAAVQGKGFGERAMKLITSQADRYGVTLTLVASGNGDPSEDRLVRWYTRHGFVMSETDYDPDDEPNQNTYTEMARAPVAASP